MSRDGYADVTGLRIRVIVFGRSFLGNLGDGIAFRMAVAATFCSTVLKIGKLLDPCREGTSASWAFLTICHNDC